MVDTSIEQVISKRDLDPVDTYPDVFFLFFRSVFALRPHVNGVFGLQKPEVFKNGLLSGDVLERKLLNTVMS